MLEWPVSANKVKVFESASDDVTQGFCLVPVVVDTNERLPTFPSQRMIPYSASPRVIDPSLKLQRLFSKGQKTTTIKIFASRYAVVASSCMSWNLPSYFFSQLCRLDLGYNCLRLHTFSWFLIWMFLPPTNIVSQNCDTSESERIDQLKNYIFKRSNFIEFIWYMVNFPVLRAFPAFLPLAQITLTN
jgi:hypothetical protein